VTLRPAKGSRDYVSPGKVNLSFRVVGQREDGYHNVASLYHAVSLRDHLSIQESGTDCLVVTGRPEGVPVDSTNLILKAAALFRIKTRLSIYAAFHLDKQIPLQAGLGGGSSNAATALWALNQLAGRPVSPSDLQMWGGELGSDVPFFFSRGSAYCTGRGEEVHSLPPLEPEPFWIVKPPYGLSTPRVYEALTSLWPLPDDRRSSNDLEIPAFTLVPELALLKRRLLSLGFSRVVMTGSGTSFACFGGDRRLSWEKFPELEVYPVTFLSRSCDEMWYVC
jgi:4-diphosphocytidyl-2-C-methyl-D-erythritol kinase